MVQAVHWIRAVGDYQQLLDLVRAFIPGEWRWDCIDRGLHFRQRRLIGPLGVSVSFDEEEGVRVRAILEFPGEACDRLGRQCYTFLMRFNPDQLRRVDLAWDGWTDDQGKHLSPGAVYSMIEEDGTTIRSRIDRDKVTLTKQVGGSQTCYIGSRQSERFLRCYNKRGFTRIELQLGQRFAAAYVASLRAGMSWVQVGCGFLRDFVDFVQAGHSNISRAPLQSWWSRVVESWSRIKLSAPQPVQSLDRCRQWLRDQVSAILATVVRADCGDFAFIDELLAVGEARRGPRHSQLLIGAALDAVGPPPF